MQMARSTKHRHAMHARLIFLGGWIILITVSDVYIFTKVKSINAEKNENAELTHTQRYFVVDCVCCANNCNQK